MKNKKPVIGITMGDPVGIGPEIILLALRHPAIYDLCRPVVLGDINILKAAAKHIKKKTPLPVSVPNAEFKNDAFGKISVISLSDLDPETTVWGKPTQSTGKAMIEYINTAVDMALEGKIDAVVTCPINKAAMKMAGSKFTGHTEMLAQRTGTQNYAMMMAGDKLRVVLVTIHVPLSSVTKLLDTRSIISVIEITCKELKKRFGIKKPKIAVAALNPHAGEEGLFGYEEDKIIKPAIRSAGKNGCDVFGPFPPDTLFYSAVSGKFDAVVCMYHDQGLIPFKMIHFADGVNITLGLPIIRTSVDHGTAYDIAGTGTADPGSLEAAIASAAGQSVFIQR